jgi:hypothetical protein
MSFPKELDEEAKEYAFKRKEAKRQQLIKMVKERRNQLMRSKGENEGSQMKSKSMEEENKEEAGDDKDTKIWKDKVKSEIDKDKKIEAINTRNEEIEMRKTQSKFNRTTNSFGTRKDMEKTETKKKLTKEQEDKEMKKKFKEELLEKQNKEKERKKLLRDRENELKKKREKREERIREANERIEMQRFADYEKRDKELQLLYKRIHEFEKTQRPELLKRKTMTMEEYREKHEQAKERLSKQTEESNKQREEKYNKITKELEDSNERAIKNRKEMSESIKEYLKTKNEGVRNKQEALDKQQKEKTAKMKEKNNENTKRIQEEKKKEAVKKKYYAELNAELKCGNLNRMKQKKQMQDEQLRGTINAKREKLKEIEEMKAKELEAKKQQQHLKEKKQWKLQEAYNYMAVWNAWDDNMIQQIAENDSEAYEIGHLMTEIINNRNKREEENKSCDGSRAMIANSGDKNNFQNSDRPMQATVN